MRSVLGFIAVAALALPGAARADSVAELERLLAQTRTLRGEFTQELLDEQGAVVKRSSGTMLLARPGRFRWDYAAPDAQTIVSDGTRLWIFDPELAQVTVKAVDGTLARSPAALLGGSAPLAETFAATDLGSADGLAWVALEPQVKDSDFQQVRLGVGKRAVEVMELTDGLGQTTRIRFADVEVNAAVDDRAFRFVPPAGVDVVGEGAADEPRP